MYWTREHGDLKGKIILLLGLGILLIVIAHILPDPLAQNLDIRFSTMALPYSLGTDQLGRDLSSRLYFGLIHSVGVISLTMLATLAISIPTGLLAARYQWASSMLNIIAGAIWSMPTFIIALIVFVGFKGEWIELKFALLGLFNWVPIFRSVRDITKQVQQAYYVMFAKAMGMGDRRVYLQQILPNVMPGVYPIVLLNLISLFEVEFVLSFLGLSYADPTPTLGGMLRQGIAYLNFNMIFLPSLLLCIVIQMSIFYKESLKNIF
jgi:peptide/nickel transport system permease protein